MKPDAILFDFNGVLLEDEAYHLLAFREALAQLGIRIGLRLYRRRYLALDDRRALVEMLRDASSGSGRPGPALVTRLLRAKRRAYARLCGPRFGIEPRVARAVRALARRVPLAIVSGAARREILHHVRRAGLERCFETIVAAEDVERRKPHPDLYLRALARLARAGRAVEGARCLALEDSPGGIQAAVAAGVPVVGVATSYPAGTLTRAGAFRVIASLSGLAAGEILALPG